MEQIEQSIQPFIYQETKKLYLNDGLQGSIIAPSLNCIILQLTNKGLIVTDKQFKIYCKFTKRAYQLFLNSVPNNFTLDDIQNKIISLYNPYLKIFGSRKRANNQNTKFGLRARLIVDELIMAPNKSVVVENQDEIELICNQCDIKLLVQYKLNFLQFKSAQLKFESQLLSVQSLANALEGKRNDQYQSAVIEVNPFKYSIKGFQNVQEQDFDIDLLSSCEEEKKEGEESNGTGLKQMIQIFNERKVQKEQIIQAEKEKQNDFEELKNDLMGMDKDDELDMQSSQSQQNNNISSQYKPDIGIAPNAEVQQNKLIKVRRENDANQKKKIDSQQDLLDLIMDSSQSSNVNKKEQIEEVKNQIQQMNTKLTTEQSEENIFVEISEKQSTDFKEWLKEGITNSDYEAYKAWFDTKIVGNSNKPQFKANHNFQIQVVEKNVNPEVFEKPADKPRPKEETIHVKNKNHDVDYCRVVENKQKKKEKEKIDNVFEGESVEKSVDSEPKDKEESLDSEPKEEKVRQIPSYKESKKRKHPGFKVEEQTKKSKQKKLNTFL